jgi:cytoskeletal protein CcmA (bactofilin family)
MGMVGIDNDHKEGIMFKKLSSTADQDVSIPTEAATAAATPVPATEARVSPRPDIEKSRLIVGPNIKLKGVEITDCDTLLVEGRVEASMDSRVIQIAEGGVFAGTVGVDRAEIRGRFEGEMTVRDRLVVHATGRVSGKVRYGRLAVEEGGELTGDLEALPKREVAASAPTPTLKPAVEPDTPAKLKREPFAHPSPGQPAHKNGGGHAHSG